MPLCTCTSAPRLTAACPARGEARWRAPRRTLLAQWSRRGDRVLAISGRHAVLWHLDRLCGAVPVYACDFDGDAWTCTWRARFVETNKTSFWVLVGVQWRSLGGGKRGRRRGVRELLPVQRPPLDVHVRRYLEPNVAAGPALLHRLWLQSRIFQHHAGHRGPPVPAECGWCATTGPLRARHRGGAQPNDVRAVEREWATVAGATMRRPAPRVPSCPSADGARPRPRPRTCGAGRPAPTRRRARTGN